MKRIHLIWLLSGLVIFGGLGLGLYNIYHYNSLTDYSFLFHSTAGSVAVTLFLFLFFYLCFEVQDHLKDRR